MLPVPLCSHFIDSSSELRTEVVRFGSFRRKHDGRLIPRYRCKKCGKSFSDSTFTITYRQKKPYLNPIIAEQLASLGSQRRVALMLRVNRKTVIRKFIFVGERALGFLPLLNRNRPKVSAFEFDDQETLEHTKCKPLSITMAVEKKSRWIIGFRVSSFQATGHLAKIALKKYGRRQDTRKQKRKALFSEITEFIEPTAAIDSDMNPFYAPDVNEFFPNARYRTYRRRESRSQGQGELKKGPDPIFTINHTFAMCRANINRLIRKTWCTTKKPERLEYHIAIYSIYHNLFLLKPKERDVLKPKFLSAV